MRMEVLAVQQQYQSQYGVLGSNKVKDWTSTLTPPTRAAVAAEMKKTNNNSNNNINNINKTKNSINKIKTNRTVEMNNRANSISSHSHSNGKLKSRATNVYSSNSSSSVIQPTTPDAATATATATASTQNLFYCDDIDAAAVNELSLRLLDELRAAKSRHLTCTEVSLPCDLTSRIAAEIIRVSEKEPRGIRGCTIYIEFEDEPNNSRRIATLRLDPDTVVSTFEVYLTLRQDHRGWTSLLPQFMKSLARTITISPEFTITKHKLYSPHESSYTSFYGNGAASSAAISTPSS